MTLHDHLAPAALAWLGIPADASGPDVDAAPGVAEAVVDFITRNPGSKALIDSTRVTDLIAEIDLAIPDGDLDRLPTWYGHARAAHWPASVAHGAVMLAARLIRRRNSASGVEAFAAEGAAYVSRTDPDLARLLRLDRYAAPRVG